VLGNRVPGAATGSDRRLQCLASLAQRLPGTSEPARRTGTTALQSGPAAIASWRKGRGHGGGAVFRFPNRFFCSAASLPRPTGVGQVIRLARLGQHGDSVACVA
jgi:hypothetical protein